MRSSTIRSEVGGGTLSRIVYPLPAVKVLRLCVEKTPIRRSPFAVVVALPLSGEPLVRLFDDVTSSAFAVAMPEYSRMAKRRDAEVETVTVTVLAPAAMF